MVSVAEAAAVRAGVALARIRSTSSAMKPSMMVVQLVGSPPALPSLISTLSPNSSFKASLKPWVAALRASWGSSWQMPTT